MRPKVISCSQFPNESRDAEFSGRFRTSFRVKNAPQFAISPIYLEEHFDIK